MAPEDPLRAQRLKALEDLRILDTPPEAAFDDIVKIAAAVCESPAAAVSFITDTRQWFKAATGLTMSETPLADSVCAVALRNRDLTVVNDLSLDPRFETNDFVTAENHLRFYAGAPVQSPDGVPIGMVCVLDTEPRPQGLNQDQREILLALARQVAAQLKLRSQAAALEDSEARFRAIADSMPQMVWSTLPDGFHDYYNARWYEFTGVPAGSTDGEAWNGMFHPEDQARAWTAWRRSLETGEPYEIEYRLRHHTGEYLWTLGRALPIRDESGRITRWFGTCTDIQAAKRAAEERELISHELSHRIKNIFSVIGGLVGLSARLQPEHRGFADRLRDRIQALSRAHDFVRPHSDKSRPADQQTTALALLRELVAPYQDLGGDRIMIGGDDLPVDDRAATPLALVFHELATNAAKYGALSSPDGRVEIEGRREAEAYTLSWRETGGPLVEGPPLATGFGSVLARVSVEGQLDGVLTQDWRSEGLVVTISVANRNLVRATA